MTRPLATSLAAAALSLLLPHAASAGPLSLEQFFNGKLSATGTADNLRDGTRRSFTIAMTASWKGPVGTLVEEVAFADGERQHKVWTFEKVGEGRFVGHREDLTQNAEVVEDGQGVLISYKANTRLPSGISFNLAFEDRMTPVSRDVVSVTTDVTYLFLSAARLNMTITRAVAK